MIVGGLILIEGVRCEIQHTVVETLVVQDLFVGLCHLLRCLTLTLRHKHLVVEVTLVHRPEIHETDHEDDADSILLLQFAKSKCEQDTRSHQDDIERTQGIAGKHGLTHLRQISHQRSHMFCWQTLQRLHLTRRDKTAEECRRHHREQQGNNTRQQE